MKIIFNEIIEEFLKYCNEEKIDIYLVGGAIRDYLMGKETYDLDFALTSDYYIALEKLNSKYNCEKYDTYQAIKISISNYNIEISHCREENEYLDYRHPNLIEFCNDIKTDSKRRDFTINALYYKDGIIYDFYNGKEDLLNNKLKVIGDTLTRFKEDPLRILRMIRFSSMGFDISIEDERIIKDNVYLLKEINKEAFFSEFDKILMINNLYVIYSYKEIFEEYFDLKFKDLSVLSRLTTIEEKKTYLGINNKSNLFKYRDLYINNNYIELSKLIYKLSKDLILELVLYHDKVYEDSALDTFNEIINKGFYDKSQIALKSEELIELTKKKELTSYYIDQIAYSIINGNLKNEKEEIRKYILEIMK